MTQSFTSISERPPRAADEVQVRDPGAALCKPIPDAPRTGVLGTLALALPSFGLLPVVIWQLRFHQAIAEERRQYEDVAKWAEGTISHPAARKLSAAANALRANPVTTVLIAGCCAGVVLLFARSMISAGGGFDLVVHATYGYPGFWRTTGQFTSASGSLRRTLFIGWTGGLSVAYFCHWLQVHLHARRVRAFLDLVGVVAIHDGLAPIFLDPIGPGIRPLWLLGMTPLLMFNALWGVPMMFAGAVQRRYARNASRACRKALAGRMQNLSDLRGPASAPVLATAVAIKSRRRCDAEKCLAVLPVDAAFCPRCGQRAVPTIDQKA